MVLLIDHYISGFLEGAIKAFSPESKFEETGGMDDQGGDVATDEVANNGSFAGVLGLLGTAATTATSVSANAAQTATAATSWFAKRLSSKNVQSTICITVVIFSILYFKCKFKILLSQVKNVKIA